MYPVINSESIKFPRKVVQVNILAPITLKINIHSFLRAEIWTRHQTGSRAILILIL